jgi:hypothetical protein
MIDSLRPLRSLQLAIALFIALSALISSGEDCSTVKLTTVFRSGNAEVVYDEFASSIAANDSIMVVGARADGRSPIGALHVFVRDGSSWGGHQRLQFANGQGGAFLGDAVAVDGDSIIAGLPAAGCVYIFNREGTNWLPRQRVVPSDTPTGQYYFGYSVAVADDTMVVGSPASDNGVGSAYVFTRVGTNWIETAKLRPDDGLRLDAFGWSVAVDQERIVVGAARHAGALKAGIAYVFRDSEGVWLPEAKLFPDNSQLYGNGGIAVTISGKNAAINYVGYPKAVHLFRRTNDTWTHIQKIVATNANLEGGFGLSLQMIGDRLAIGSPGSANGGRVHLLAQRDGAWIEDQTIDSVSGFRETYFGGVLALFSHGIFIGAHGDLSGPDRSAAVFSFEYDTEPPVIESIEAIPNILCPPNRRLMPVTVEIAAIDSCGPVTCRISRVWSDRVLNQADWEITGDLSVKLRATRNEDGSQRTYKLTVDCSDSVGHSSSADVVVVVPHDRRKPRRVEVPVSRQKK